MAMAKLVRVVPCLIVFVASALVASRLLVLLSGVGMEALVPPSLAQMDLWGVVAGATNVNASASGEGREGAADADPLRVASVGLALHPFVFFSASRASLTTFHVLGLAAKLLRSLDGGTAYECVWQAGMGQANNASKPELVTRPQLSYANTESFKVPYVMLILTCSFGEDVGTDGLGGTLSLTVKVGPFVGPSSTTFVALRESAGYDARAVVTAPPPFKYVFCGAAISGASVKPQVIKQWLIYHMYVAQGPKAAHFIFYDIGGLTQAGRTLLDPFVRAGFLTILDVSDQTRYPSWYHGQVLLINECLHRTRFMARWALFLDFDEFLYAEPPRTFAGIVDDNANASVLTFGSWPISIRDCRPATAEDAWPADLARMLWRRPQPECRGAGFPASLCLAAQGRRKYAVNPRHEFFGSIHQTLGRTWKEAVHLNASLVRLEHYQGLLAKDTCTTQRTAVSVAKDRQFAQWWVQLQPAAIVPTMREARDYARQLLNDPLL